LDQEVLEICFGVFHKYVKVTIVVKNSSVEKFVLGVTPAATVVFIQELVVRKRGLRILVQILHIRMRGSVVEIEVAFLYILAVISLLACKTKETFLQEGIAAVPQCKREADMLMAVADPGQSVFVPAVDSGAGVVMREVIPGVAIAAVVFADRAPGSLAEIRTPTLPVFPALPRLC
jgi:hypothetical protein